MTEGRVNELEDRAIEITAMKNIEKDQKIIQPL